MVRPSSARRDTMVKQKYTLSGHDSSDQDFICNKVKKKNVRTGLSGSGMTILHTRISETFFHAVSHFTCSLKFIFQLFSWNWKLKPITEVAPVFLSLCHFTVQIEQNFSSMLRATGIFSLIYAHRSTWCWDQFPVSGPQVWRQKLWILWWWLTRNLVSQQRTAT